MIHGGDDGGTGRLGTSAVAVHRYPVSAILRHNTLYVASGTAVYAVTGLTGLVVENNLIAGGGGDAVALLSEDCPDGGAIASWRNNLTVGLLELGYGDTPGSTCLPGALFATDEETEAELRARCTKNTAGACAGFHGTQASGNRSLAQSCGADSGCIAVAACTDAASCAGALFAPWDTATHGEQTLFATGWKLADGAPCAVAHSSLNLSTQVPTDFYRVARSSMPTWARRNSPAPAGRSAAGRWDQPSSRYLTIVDSPSTS